MGSNFKVLISVSCLILIMTSILNLVLNTSHYFKIYSSSPKIQDIHSTFRCEREKRAADHFIQQWMWPWRCFVFSVDQEFDTVSGFLLKRTKDMVNKYRQLLVREAQVRIKRASASSQRCLGRQMMPCVTGGMWTCFHSRRVRRQRWWCWSVSSSRLSDAL